MMTSPRDLEDGVAVADGNSKFRKLLQRKRQEMSETYLARYTNLRALLDQDWRRFLEKKHVDSGRL